MVAQLLCNRDVIVMKDVSYFQVDGMLQLSTAGTS